MRQTRSLGSPGFDSPVQEASDEHVVINVMKTIKVMNWESVAAAGDGQGDLCAETGNGRCKRPELGRWDVPCLRDRKKAQQMEFPE